MPKRVYYFILFSAISWAACGPIETKKPAINKSNIKADASVTLKVKALKTEKTHEGGVDQTQKIFKKE